MKKSIVIFILFMLLPLSSLLATNGEFFIRVAGFGSSQWVLRFEKIPGEFYYDENFNIVTPYDLVFARTGDAILPGAGKLSYRGDNGCI